MQKLQAHMMPSQNHKNGVDSKAASSSSRHSVFFLRVLRVSALQIDQT
jgi:hypothetical protein